MPACKTGRHEYLLMTNCLVPQLSDKIQLSSYLLYVIRYLALHY